MLFSRMSHARSTVCCWNMGSISIFWDTPVCADPVCFLFASGLAIVIILICSGLMAVFVIIVYCGRYPSIVLDRNFVLGFMFKVCVGNL